MVNKQHTKALQKVRRHLHALLDGLETDQVEVCIPEKLTREYLATHTPAGVAEAEWTEFARYLVNRVVVATLNGKFKRGRNKWVPLPIQAFRDLAPAKYRLMRQALFDLSILVCDNKYNYLRGLSYGYRLGKRYRRQHLKFRSLQTSEVVQRLRVWNRQELKRTKQQLSAIAHVAKGWLDYPHINLDQVQAQAFLDRYREVLLLEVRGRTDHGQRGWKQKQNEREVLVDNLVIQARRQVQKWGRLPRLAVDQKGGRFYNPLTSMMSRLRHFVTYKGSPLVSLDLKNSQPLHLLLVVTSEFWKEKSRQSWALHKLDKDLWTATEEGLKELKKAVRERGAENSPLTELYNPGQHVDDEWFGVSQFTELVRTGKLYEFIADSFKGKFFTHDGIDRFGTRELTKREVLRLMYFDDANMNSPAQAPFQEFGQLFPGIAALMALLKRRHYTDFSVLLQKLEAHLMLDKVCRRIYDRAPEAWFTTIHDAILTTPEHADLVQEILFTTYEEVLGVAPTIERSDLHPDAAFDGLFDYVRRKVDKHIGEGEAQEGHDKRLQVEHWLRTQLTGVDASLAYPFTELVDASPTANPFEESSGATLAS